MKILFLRVFDFEELYIRNLRIFLLKTLVISDLWGPSKIVSYEHVLISRSLKWKSHFFYYRNIYHRTLNRKHISFKTLILSVKSTYYVYIHTHFQDTPTIYEQSPHISRLFLLHFAWLEQPQYQAAILQLIHLTKPLWEDRQNGK